MKCSESQAAPCGLFGFMSSEMGVQVLHPGGYEATDCLFSSIGLNEGSSVLDLACGVGSTSFRLAQKYNCKVTGIDISENLINAAQSKLKKYKNAKTIRFEVADALSLPFADQSFDAVIAQAFLILIDDKEKALEEIYRVLKPGGYVGSIELSWFTSPSPEVYRELYEKTCTTFIPRMLKFEEWEALFRLKNFNHQSTQKRPMSSGMMQMLKAEGLTNFIRIIRKMMANASNRKRMMAVQDAFQKHSDYIGYGIYVFQK